MNALTVGELAAILTELRAARTELQEVRRLLAGCVAALGVEPEPADLWLLGISTSASGCGRGRGGHEAIPRLVDGAVAQRTEPGGPVVPCPAGAVVDIGPDMAKQLLAMEAIEPAEGEAKPKRKASHE